MHGPPPCHPPTDFNNRRETLPHLPSRHKTWQRKISSPRVAQSRKSNKASNLAPLPMTQALDPASQPVRQVVVGTTRAAPTCGSSSWPPTLSSSSSFRQTTTTTTIPPPHHLLPGTNDARTSPTTGYSSSSSSSVLTTAGGGDDNNAIVFLLTSTSRCDRGCSPAWRWPPSPFSPSWYPRPRPETRR